MVGLNVLTYSRGLVNDLRFTLSNTLLESAPDSGGVESVWTWPSGGAEGDSSMDMPWVWHGSLVAASTQMEKGSPSR
jgi:hypothetical protein